MTTKGIQVDGKRARCSWCGTTEDYRLYHDEEWGRPVDDDQRLFEKVCLEGFQAGLSWLTILRKRDAFRRHFKDFDFEKVARFGDRHVERMLADAAIVRHRGKIESTIQNAKRARELVRECGSLAEFFWSFVPPPAERPRRMTHGQLMKLTLTPTSKALSRELKQRGWTYVGPTTCYAFMQAMGLVNDHLEGCFVRDEVEEEQAAMRQALGVSREERTR